MNDPHVVEYDKSSDYSLAKNIEIEHTAFRLKLEDSEARFELKEHYPTWQQAQQAIQPFIQQWELRASLESGPGVFPLKFKQPEMIDRKPTPGAISVSPPPISFHFTISIPTVTVSRQYPQPPPERRMNIDNPRCADDASPIFGLSPRTRRLALHGLFLLRRIRQTTRQEC